MSIPSNEQWKYRNSVPQINLLTPCQPPNLVQFSRDWNFYLNPQELVTPLPPWPTLRMSAEELAAYDKSLAPKLNQLRVDSSVQNFSQITVSRKTVVTDDQNTEQIVGNGEDIPVVLQTQENVSLAAPKLIKPPVNGVAQLSNLLNGGNGYPINGFTRKVETQSLTGCGVGLTVSINVTAGVIESVNICDEGENYHTGDKISIINPLVTSLDTSNIITNVPLTNFAPNSLTGASPGVNTISNPITSGSGSGATIVVTIGLFNVVTSVVATDGGSGYAVGDTITILAGQIAGPSRVPLVITVGASDIASNATISVDILAPSPLASTQTDGYIQMDQGGFQLPSGPWGAQLGIVALRYTGGSINGTSQSRIVVETCQPHGLNSCDKVTINGVDQFGSSNNFDVISIHDANKFEINNPYEYGVLPVGTALNALVVPHRQKSSIDQAGLSVPYRSAVSKTIQKQVFPTTELYACTEVGCNNQNYDFSNLNGKTGANGVPAQSIYSDPPPILQPQNFRGPVATSFGVSKQLNASELAMLQLNSVPFPL